MLTIKPKTRKEIYLAYLSGDMSLELPEPLTRDEVNLYNLCKNKAYGEYTTVKEVLAECQPEYADGLGFVIAGRCSLAIGGKYIVNYNGVDYECVGVDGAELNAPGSVFLGNTYAVTGGGMTHMDKRPFYLAYVPEEDVVAVAPLDGSTTLTISIRQEVTEVKKISGKYVEGMGYSEKSENMVLAECQLVTTDNRATTTLTRKLAEGETYIVNWNGTEYTCTAFVGEGVMIGNPISFTGKDTGEPFLCADFGDTFMVMPLDGSTTLTISIRQEVETIHPIDPKFLPSGGGGGGLLVNLTEAGAGMIDYDVDYDTVKSAINSGVNVVFALKTNAGGNNITYYFVSEYIEETDYSGYDLATFTENPGIWFGNDGCSYSGAPM